jgi:hypothetical protein
MTADWRTTMPASVARLPRDHRGFPIPWFVQQDPVDFRVIRPLGFARAHQAKLCWVCGEPRYEKRLCFTVGPMCVVNRVSAEPPAHPECARFSARACPFLSNPRMRRNEKDLPEDAVEAAGVAIKRNPGVTALVFAGSYSLMGVGEGVLIRLERIRQVEWWREGRLATRAEALASIESGLPLLEDMARQDGDDAVCELEIAAAEAFSLLPAEETEDA